MKTLSLYRPRDTFIHNGLDPFTKLIYLICSMISAFFIPTFSGALGLLVINLGLLAWAKEIKRALKTLAGSLLLLVTIFVIQGLFHPGNKTLLLALGPVHVYREGVVFALTISFRVVNIIAASSVLILTTSPTAVMEACVRRGLSPKIGYVITAILQMIPVMMDTASTIREAQQSRGMSMEGGLWHRMRAFLPLFGPIVLSSFLSIQDRAMALEVRGFSVRGKRTFLHDETVLRGSLGLRMVFIIATLCIIVWGILA